MGNILLFTHSNLNFMKRKRGSGYRALKVSSNLEKFPFLKCACGNRALNFMGNFRKFPRNFLETVRVLTGQKTVRVGMWSRILISNVLLLVKDSFTENY